MTPSLLSLVPGLILAVEFFASEKPSGKPLGCSATACYWCSKTEAQAWWYPQPHRAGKGFPSTRGAGQKWQSSVCSDVHHAMEGAGQGPLYSDQIRADLSFSRQKAQDASCFPVTLEPGTASSGATAVPCADPSAF